MLRAASSTSTLPCGSTVEMPTSPLVRSSLRLPFLSASDASQYFRRRSLRRVLASASRGVAARATSATQITNEALVVRYQEGNRLIISLSYSGVPRHSDRHQIEFCMFGVLRVCRMLTGQKLVPQHFSIAHHRSGGNSEMAPLVETQGEYGAGKD